MRKGRPTWLSTGCAVSVGRKEGQPVCILHVTPNITALHLTSNCQGREWEKDAKHSGWTAVAQDQNVSVHLVGDLALSMGAFKGMG